MRDILLALALLVHLTLSAQPVTSPVKKVAIISLIGDELSVDVYRNRVGTSLDTNAREVVALQNPVFDHTALFAAADAATKLMPHVTFLPLAVPKAGGLLDPNLLIPDNTNLMVRDTSEALKQQGFDHVLAISKHTARARMRAQDGSLGAGYVRGLGFYVDNFKWTRRLDTGQYGEGFIAPYAYLKLSLIDLSTRAVVREEILTASVVQSAARNNEGLGAWDAMSPTAKTDMLRGFIQSGVSAVTTTLLTNL